MIDGPRDSNAAASPDGRFLAVGMPSLGLLELATSTFTRLREFPPGTNPTWSPDGTRILVVGTVDPYDFGSILLLDLGSGSSKRITTSRGLETDPAWSPDGKWIAFASDQGQNQIGQTRVFIAPSSCIKLEACGDAARAITDLTAGDSSMSPSWAPDSARLAFSQTTQMGGIGIYLYNFADGAITLLVDTLDDEVTPQWSPDGNWIGFTRVSVSGDAGRAMLVRPDGRDEHTISPQGVDEWLATWIRLQ
jgi:TolB protein